MPASRFVAPARIVRNCALILLCGVLGRDASEVSQTQTRRLLLEFVAAQHSAGSRLAGMPYVGPAAVDSSHAARLDPLPLATNGTSLSQRRLLSLLYIFDGQWQNAEQVLGKLALELPGDAAIQNDLGVVQMALAAADPTAWFKAIQRFKLASAAQSDLPEPKFNLILIYRRLGLHRLEAATTEEYLRIEPGSPWNAAIREPAGGTAKPKSFVTKVDVMRPDEISVMVAEHPEESRKLLLDYAFHPVLPIPGNYERIALELSDRYGDATAELALAPISTNESADVLHARKLVEMGRSLYFRGDLDASRKAYAQAQAYISRTNSVFDRLWVEINAADSMTRMRNFAEAAVALQDAVKNSREYRLQWVLAGGLSAFGSDEHLSGRFLDTMSRLNEAVRIYRAIGAGPESARPLYYLAAYNWTAYNLEESLNFALESLKVTDPADNVRLCQLHWLISNILYSMGYSEMATHFNEEATDHAEKVGNPGLIASMSSQLASLYLLSSRNEMAAEQIENSAKALEHMLSNDDRHTSELSVNLVRARILLSTGDFSAAEQTLRKTIDLFHQNPTRPVILHSQSRFLLAKALSAQGRTHEAELEFRKAVELVEAQQNYLTNLNFQVSFDQQRRQVYDSAISFEYDDNNNCEESWNLMQGYKAKLFLDVLGRFETPANAHETTRLTRSQVASRIPENVQLIDYGVLSDRILIWVHSPDGLQCRSTRINRYQLQKRVDSFLRELMEKRSTEQSSQELYDLLVEPIEQLLDTRQTLVIIPDGILHRLPFSALRSRRDHRYWIEKMPILQSPSISYFLSDNASPASNKTLIAFGSRTQDVLMNKELASLREIEPGVKVRTGPDVTKEVFLRAVGENSLLYYAGHSVFDVADPLRSLILLDGDKPGPNSVSALDIVQRRMVKNGIVILASCDTSLGNFTDGPGIRGLTSAFLISGAGSVIGSLWPVQSSSTNVLMPILFNSLAREDASVAQSLRSAQLRLIRSAASDPYHWAGFVLTGNLSAAVRRVPYSGKVGTVLAPKS